MNYAAVFFKAVDLILIEPYRWPSDPLIGWWVGTSILALWVVLIGQATATLAFHMNRPLIQEVNQEVVSHHKNSISALKIGDKATYEAINDLANDAYGRTFFLQIATAASYLWPVPLALAWLQSRFSGVHFSLPFHLPFVDDQVSYPFIFIPLYILMRLAFAQRNTIWSFFRKSP